MCGIVGYIGNRQLQEVIVHGLRRLEYRGYDSAGIAALHKGKLSVVRSEGKIERLEKRLEKSSFDGTAAVIMPSAPLTMSFVLFSNG